MVFGTTIKKMPTQNESTAAAVIPAQKRLSPQELNQFDKNLLSVLSCVKALNFRHIAYIGRELDNIEQSQAYNILWHKAAPQSENSFKRLKKLCEFGWVLPWKSWNPDRILLDPARKAQPGRGGVFYILGREGRRWVRNTLGLKPMPFRHEELYLSLVPLSRWLTASCCALTLDYEGARLLSPGEAWSDNNVNLEPTIKPDFVVNHIQTTAFYICDSPFALDSDFLVAQVFQGLNFLGADSKSIILTRTKDAFDNIFISMKKIAMDGNIGRVYAGDIEAFKNANGHCSIVNAREILDKL